MRIMHCCLAAFYIDNYGYQENILPKMHKLQGHEVAIVASTETYINNTFLGYVDPCSYYTEENIPIRRIPYTKILPHWIAKKLRIYTGLYDAIESFMPDIIFLHDCQFISIRKIALYAKTHRNVIIYVDGHTDFTNSAKTWISKNVLHRIIYKHCAKVIEPFTRKFYGVLPVRVNFFQTMYNIPSKKTELLVMGADDTKVNYAQRNEIRGSIRDSLKIQSNDFVIVSGGKIDQRKNIHVLMRTVHEINQKDVKLIVFGTPNKQLEHEVIELSHHDCIKYVGWITPEKVYDYFLSSDLGVFPGTHSVLWEQAVGVGLPCIFRKWGGIQHIDLGGNCLFLNSGNKEEIKNSLLFLIRCKEKYFKMKETAINKGIKAFSYYEIAKKAIKG